MNNLDKQYQNLLKDILDNGTIKKDRTGTGTKSVFGRQIKHKMSEGFPLLTTKKLPFKSIAVELLWFISGSSDIRYLWDRNVTIWDGDWYKHYKTTCSEPYSLEEIKEKLKTSNHQFHDTMFSLGPIYGTQWRKWEYGKEVGVKTGELYPSGEFKYDFQKEYIDQIDTLLKTLNDNPDSRRMMVNAWNVGELDKMTLPPCHYGFQVYTRELNHTERCDLFGHNDDPNRKVSYSKWLDDNNFPKRTISLLWNQRSVDTFLGLPFNIASYGLLLQMLGNEMNMIPDELIGNLGDTHLYLNHIEQAKIQIERESYDLPNVIIEDGMFSVLSDLHLENYKSHKLLKGKLSN